MDIPTSIDGLDFASGYANRSTTIEKGITVTVVSKEHLLFVRQLAAKNEKRRAKETHDIRFLESI